MSEETRLGARAGRPPTLEAPHHVVPWTRLVTFGHHGESGSIASLAVRLISGRSGRERSFIRRCVPNPENRDALRTCPFIPISRRERSGPTRSGVCQSGDLCTAANGSPRRFAPYRHIPSGFPAQQPLSAPFRCRACVSAQARFALHSFSLTLSVPLPIPLNNGLAQDACLGL